MKRQNQLSAWLNWGVSEAPFFIVSIAILFFFAWVRLFAGLDTWSAYKMLLPIAYFYFYPKLLEPLLRPHLSGLNPRPFAWVLMFFGFMTLAFVFKTFTFPVLIALGFFISRRKNTGIEILPIQWQDFLLALIPLLAFSVFISDTLWHSGYLTPFFREALNEGLGKSDSLSHMSYSVMLGQYQALTVGLHGFTPIRYHLGVHTFLLALGRSLGEDPAYCFSVGYPVLVPALLLQSIWCLGETFCSVPKRVYTRYTVPFLAILILQVFPFTLLDQYGYWKSFFISESHGMGLLLLTFFAWILLELLREPSWMSRLSTPVKISIAALLAILLFWIVFTKVSTGFVCAALLGLYVLYDFKKGQRIFLACTLMVSAALAILSFKLSAKSMPNPFEWNYFIKSYGHTQLGYYFFFYIHLWLALLMGAIFWFKRSYLPEPRRPYLFLLASAAFCFALTWPSIHFQIDGGSGYYFTNITMWLAIYSAIAAFSMLLAQKNLHRMVLILILAGAYASFSNFMASAHGLVGLAREGKALAQNQSPETLGFRTFLAELDRIKTDLPKDYFVYIPSRENLYWFKKDYALSAMALAIPVVSGHPAIFGAPSNPEIKESGSFRFWFGAFPEYWNLAVSPTEAQLCEEVRKFAFHHYVQLGWDQQNLTVLRQIKECP